MNLQGITAGAVSAVNPPVPCTIARSTGYTIAADGTQVPTYQQFPDIPCQVQPLTGSDIRRLDALNTQSIMKAFYITGQLAAIVRPNSKGGDIITMPNGSVWLTTQVLEHWDTVGWCKVVATLQDGS